MAIFVNSEDKSMWMYEGDTGNIYITGLPSDKSYDAYFAIYDEEKEKIVLELSTITVAGVAGFQMTVQDSDKLRQGNYTWALKGCFGSSEDTWVPETKLIDGYYIAQPAPVFEVRAKRVEGIE